MKLYHGSKIEIKSICFEKCKPYKDFWQGCYLTEIKDQSLQMAKRTASIYGGDPIVTLFEFDEIILTDTSLSIKIFEEPNEEWALFVMANRSREKQHPFHEYDIVIGPVADDAIATLFRNFDDGIIDLPMLVNGLKYKKISSQYFFSYTTVGVLSKNTMKKNVQYLIEGITKDIIAYLMQDNNMDISSAISLFHNSETFEKLSDDDTGLYIESSAYVYEILKTEIKMGKYHK